jgi:fibronectin-binding autotransporter adhesin
MKTIHQLRITAVIGAALTAVSVSAATLTRTATGDWDLTTVAWTNAVSGGPKVAWDNEAWNMASTAFNVTIRTDIRLGGLTITAASKTVSADTGKRLLFATGGQLNQSAHHASTVSASILGTNLVMGGGERLNLSGTANELSGDLAVADAILSANNNTVFNGLTSLTATNKGTYLVNGNYTANAGLTVRLAGNGCDNRGAAHFNDVGVLGVPVELLGATRLGIGGDANGSMAAGVTQVGTVSGAISGGFAIEFASRGATGSTGVVELASANTFSGASTLARIDGTSITVLRLSHADALQASTYNNTVSYGLLQFSGLSSATFGGLAGNQPLALANLAGGAVALTVGNNNASTAYSGALSSAGSLTKTGSGTLTLSGTNTYSGATLVRGGKLAGVVGSSCANSAVTVSNAIGCVLGVSVTDNMKQWSCASVTFDGADAGLAFDFGAAITPSSSTAPLQVNGNVTFTGTPSVTVIGNTLPLGTYPLMAWTGTPSGTAPTKVTLPAGVKGSLSVIGSTLYLEVKGPLTWDITDTTDQTINDGSGTWSTNAVNALWNDATSNNVNRAWDNAADGDLIAQFGADGTAGTVTLSGTLSVGGLSFSAVTNSYTLTGGELTAPGGVLSISNSDTGADRRTSTGASIGSLLTGNMNAVFSGSGDNVGLSNTANDFVGEVRLNGGGISIASNGALGNSANDLAVLGAGSNLRNTAAITVNRELTFSSGAALSLVNSGNILTLAGNISGGDSASTLTIGAGHGNSYDHTVRITGTNTMAGTIRIFNVLRAYEGIGLSTNANIKLGDYFNYGTAYANTCGFLETSGDFIRALGTAANQFQWESSGAYNSGGFSAVGDVLTINFGGLSTPSSLTWNSTTGFLVTDGELRLQNASATHDLVWKNPVSLNGAVRVICANSSIYPAIMEGVLSGTGSSGISKEGVGILCLTATNTYTGVTTIAAGTLQIGNGGTTGTLGAGTVANNAKLVVNRSNAYNLTNLITGTGTLLKRGEGTLTLSATNTFSGLTTVSNGTLAAGCDLALNAGNALTLSGGTFDAGSFSNSLGTLTLSTGTASMMSVNTGTCKLSFSGISGTGSLDITGILDSTTLRFGTDSTALSKDQLDLIRANTKKVYLDGNGYLLIIPDGTVIRFL